MDGVDALLGIQPAQPDPQEEVIDMENAHLNITYAGQQGDLPDPMPYDASDADIKRIATEAIHNGDVPGIEADLNADFNDFVVDRFPARDGLPNRLSLRPKTPFGN
jgi:hypothetical protein